VVLADPLVEPIAAKSVLDQALEPGEGKIDLLRIEVVEDVAEDLYSRAPLNSSCSRRPKSGALAKKIGASYLMMRRPGTTMASG
jgi:hypothetical protein